MNIRASISFMLGSEVVVQIMVQIVISTGAAFEVRNNVSKSSYTCGAIDEERKLGFKSSQRWPKH